MKLLKKTALATLTVFSLSLPALAAQESGMDNKIEWFTKAQWNIPAKPVSLVHSLDGKKVFVLGNDSKVHVFTPEGTLLGSIPVDKGVTAIDIAPYGEQLFLINSENNSFTNLSVSQIAELEAGQSPFKGPADAPVTITLFTDFECPFCKKLPPVIDKVLENNPKTVKLVLKNLPLRIHPMAEPAAMAALAAHKQGKFWEFHDQLFATQELDLKKIEQIAIKLNLNMDVFKNDMISPATRALINQDIQMAQTAGVSGTPTAYVNGRKVQNRSVAGFQKLIDEEILKAK